MALATTWPGCQLVLGTSWLGYELAMYELAWVRLDRHPLIGSMILHKGKSISARQFVSVTAQQAYLADNAGYAVAPTGLECQAHLLTLHICSVLYWNPAVTGILASQSNKYAISRPYAVSYDTTQNQLSFRPIMCAPFPLEKHHRYAANTFVLGQSLLLLLFLVLGVVGSGYAWTLFKLCFIMYVGFSPNGRIGLTQLCKMCVNVFVA